MKIKTKDKTIIFTPERDAECYQLGSFFRDIPHEITITNGKLTGLKVGVNNFWAGVIPIPKACKK